MNIHPFESYVITELGKIREVKPVNGKAFSLKELYQYTGCDYVETAPCHDGRIIVMAEEPKTERVNVRATLMYKHGDHQQIRGDVLICPPQMIN